MKPVCLMFLIVLPVWLSSCERSPAPRVGQDVATSASAAVASSLRDWVVHPPIVESERDAPCPRLLSAAPNITEICCALGLADRLVGRTRYCTYPPAVQRVPSIGDLYNLNVEVLLELKPELILVSGNSRAVSDRLQRLDLRFETVPDVSLADLFAAIARIGELTGRRQTARLLAESVQTDLDAIAARFSGHPKARVLLLTAPLPDPPTQADAAGPGSFYDDLLRRAGTTNVAAPSEHPFGQLALEFILQADPDVIIELAPDRTSRASGDADARRVWAKLGPLKAVAQQRVHVLVGPQYFILGPRLAQTFEAVCQSIAEPSHE